MKSLNHTQLFDDYLEGLMNSEEATSFEDRLYQESDFKSSFEEHKELRNGIIWSGAQDLRAQIKEAEQAHFKMKVLKTPQKKSNTRLLAIAASLLVLVGTFFFLNRSGEASSAQDLYAAYYEPFNPNTGTRGEDVAKDITDFNKAYKAKNYQEALRALNIIQVEDNGQDWNLYRAICLMETDDMVGAEKVLLNVEKENSRLLSQEAKWYLSMLYLKQGMVDKARVYLEQLSADTNGDHSQEAKKIMAQIN